MIVVKMKKEPHMTPFTAVAFIDKETGELHFSKKEARRFFDYLMRPLKITTSETTEVR